MAPDPSQQVFTFETVAALVASLFEKGGNVGTKEYEAMAALDPSRTASSYEHLFRKVKARAKELLAQKGLSAPNTPGRRVNNKTNDDTQKSARAKGATGKRVRKPKPEEVDDEESPTKKVKKEPSEVDLEFGGEEEEDDGTE